MLDAQEPGIFSGASSTNQKNDKNGGPDKQRSLLLERHGPFVFSKNVVIRAPGMVVEKVICLTFSTHTDSPCACDIDQANIRTRHVSSMRMTCTYGMYLVTQDVYVRIRAV